MSVSQDMELAPGLKPVSTVLWGPTSRAAGSQCVCPGCPTGVLCYGGTCAPGELSSARVY